MLSIPASQSNWNQTAACEFDLDLMLIYNKMELNRIKKRKAAALELFRCKTYFCTLQQNFSLNIGKHLGQMTQMRVGGVVPNV